MDVILNSCLLKLLYYMSSPPESPL